MKKEEIHFPDWQRLLLGNTPWEFMLEVTLRTLIIYSVLLAVVRLLGKRMSAQMTITEMAIMVTIGGIVSVPMQSPDRGLVQGAVILVCVVLFQYVLGRLSFKNHKVETMVQGDLTLLVKDGIIEVNQLYKTGISQQNLFSQLRASNIQHLGQVKRVYLEACGIFSVFTFSNPGPGLSILPDADEKIKENEQRSKEFYSCGHCGYTIKSRSIPDNSCSKCDHDDWQRSVNLRGVKKESPIKVTENEAVER
jgi:uncharacterized membrane protein YcaP (DUF421 family)